jgi:thiol-disulfide isomerase/thioredoxin
MSWHRFIVSAVVFLTGVASLLSQPPNVLGQDGKTAQTAAAPNAIGSPAADDSIKSIEDEYTQELLRLDRRRLERLGRLAARQNPADAVATYEQLFRLAIAGNLFGDAEPAAKALLSGSSPSRTALALAHMVKIIAESDRGAYDESIESLRRAVAANDAAVKSGAPRLELPTGEIVGICEAYYQRLIHAGQYETARKAMGMILGQTARPVLKEFLSDRLRRLDQVGKPAPRISGANVEGKRFDLADARGKVVLVVFWASWCLPSAAEIESLQQVDEAYRGRGLQIVGIDLDALPDSGQKPDAALANARRFLLDYNVTWPTLINGQGQNDYAKAYGVTEIPANVLIAKDGTIAHIDLVHKNLEPMIALAVGK